MKSKKFAALLMVTILGLASILSGCGKQTEGDTATDSGNKGDTSSDSGGVNVSFWTLSTRQNAIEPIVAEFNEQDNGITVGVSYYDTDGIKDACKVAASSKTLPNMWFNWGGSLGGFYVENGVTYDLTEYAKEHDWENTFSPGALNLITLHDQISGYPTSFNVLNIYYRKDIFEEYNLAVPTTFEEFEQVCETLKANGVTPISTAGLNGWHVMRFVEQLFEYYCGTELHDKLNNFEVSWDNENVVKALEKYKEFCDKGYFPEGFVTASPDDTRLGVVTGKCAMDVQGQWYDGQLLQDGADLGNYGTFAIPTVETNRMSAFVEMTQFNANNSKEELDACMAFMDFYYSKENTDKYAEYYNLPLPRLDAEMPAEQPNVEIMMERSGENGTFTITDQAFPTEIADALFDVQDAIANGQMTPEDGAKAIQTAIDNYHNK